MEIRQIFLEFFEKRGHKIIQSASLIPENDPSVLFTTAGMHPLVPYLLGEKHPSGLRLVDIQKCIRTGDIDEVGDDVHLTFFEMLGNWSFGDYWKKEAITWSFEFLSKELKLPIEKLAVSCFAGDNNAPRDEESAEIWMSLGIPKDKIFFFGKKDNWWGPAGIRGPCGPDSEIFYWTKDSDPEPLTTGDNKSGWVEIWNDVFMQYDKTLESEFKSLKQKNVDTGMGLERTISVVNNEDMFLIDTFKPIIKKIEELSGKKYEDHKKEYRIIADHLKAATFILGDEKGISPSNTGQGYVLRRLIRRAVRYGKQIGIKSFGKEIAKIVVDIYKNVYPEIQKNKSFILENLQKEEEKFEMTLENGLKEFEKGTDPFVLFSSYGFPFELTKELAKEKGIEIDENKFYEQLKKHQELSRTASSGMFKGGLADASIETTKLHTAAHLMLEALRRTLGDHVQQKGSNITSERLRFDFSHGQKITPEQIKQIENIVNEQIDKKMPVHFEEMSVDEAKKIGATGVFEHKYGEKVKVFFVGNEGEYFSKEICGGPHVTNTGDIGHFKIVKEESVSFGTRRIKGIIK
jgi:alanyl-tRNA synthetase